ncbi:hypothetical protein [Dyella flagellata]
MKKARRSLAGLFVEVACSIAEIADTRLPSIAFEAFGHVQSTAMWRMDI